MLFVSGNDGRSTRFFDGVNTPHCGWLTAGFHLFVSGSPHNPEASVDAAWTTVYRYTVGS
jgi:hypothetical protein